MGCNWPQWMIIQGCFDNPIGIRGQTVQGTVQFRARRGSARGDRAAGGGHSGGSCVANAAGRYRLWQDLHHGPRGRGVAAPTIVMAHNKTLAAQLYGEFKEFFPDNAVEYFVSYYDYYQPEAYVPSSDTFIEKDASVNEHIEQMRLSATKALLERSDCLVVATVSAIYGLGDPKSYFKMVMHLSRGEIIDQRGILRQLAELQYTRNDIDFRRGTYRVRGDVIDIFPADSEREAVRIELFDEEIENICWFDPLTGAVETRCPASPFSQDPLRDSRETMLGAVEHIEEELEQRVKQLKEIDKLVEAQRLEQRTRYDIEMIRELGYCTGIENYSRYLSGRAPGDPPPTLFEYLPDNALVIVDESHASIPQIGGMYKGDRSRKETLVEYGFRLPSALDNRPCDLRSGSSLRHRRFLSRPRRALRRGTCRARCRAGGAADRACGS